MTGAMANSDGREALRGGEKETFDHIAEALTSEQWAELLKAPLQRAAFQGNRGLVQKLVRAGAEIGNALHAAAQGGHEGIANDLLENGASVAAKDGSSHGKGNTPLHCAAAEGKTEMVQLLLLKGADEDAAGSLNLTPLYLAVRFGSVAAALALMAAGADVNFRSRMSVVELAVQYGHMDIVTAAIERGADVDAVDPQNQGTALHVATIANKREAIDVLVEAGANIQAQDSNGCTALHNAAGRLSLEPLLALLKHGAHVNAQDNDQDTPLHWAAAMAGTQWAAEVVDSLLRSGADESILNDDGKTAMDGVGINTQQMFCQAEDVDLARKLLANAPADRAWRRRGYLVLYRAHPDRVQQIQESTSGYASKARTTRSGAKQGRTEAGGCSGAVEASPMDGGDWAVVLARVLGLQEEGIFRMIVGYL